MISTIRKHGPAHLGGAVVRFDYESAVSGPVLLS